MLSTSRQQQRKGMVKNGGFELKREEWTSRREMVQTRDEDHVVTIEHETTTKGKGPEVVLAFLL